MATTSKDNSGERLIYENGAFNAIRVLDHGEYINIPVSEIICLHFEQKYVSIYSENRPLAMTSFPLITIEEALKTSEKASQFFRISRGAIVSLNYVIELKRIDPATENCGNGEPYFVSILKGDVRIRISRRQTASTRRAHQNWVAAQLVE